MGTLESLEIPLVELPAFPLWSEPLAPEAALSC